MEHRSQRGHAGDAYQQRRPLMLSQVLVIFPFFAFNSDCNYEFRGRSAKVVFRLCMDLAFIQRSYLHEVIEDEQEAKQVLRPVSERQKSMRCGDFGGRIAR